MTERLDEWPRCHSCLYNWCPKQSEECQRCDAMIAAMKRVEHTRTIPVEEWAKRLASDLSKFTD